MEQISSPEARELAELATELRSAVTPVVGYLELLAEDAPQRPSADHLRWIEIVEERLGDLDAAARDVAAACGRLRRLSSDGEGSGAGPRARPA